MFSQNRTSESMRNCANKIEQLGTKLKEADAVIIGAGAGLSTSAGFEYSGERFHKYFSDFEAKYGFHDMYSGGFYNYETFEEYWAYWSRYIYINRYMDPPNALYSILYDLVKDKDYFVLTTNVDHCFQKAGFDKKRLYYTQGDYGLLQCSKPCCQETFDNEEIIIEMYNRQKDMKIPTELIPKCPHCGRPLTTNLRADELFVQDEGWYQAAERYDLFERRHDNVKTLYLEIGVGFNTPGIIKYNFWQHVYNNYNSSYVSINMDEIVVPDEIRQRSLLITGNAYDILSSCPKDKI